MTPINSKIGLSLSGGGYRASAFHLGTLSKLHHMGILQNTHVISTISGGSITGAAYCINEQDFKSFENRLKNDFQTRSVIAKVLGSWSFARLLLIAILFLGGSVAILFTDYPWLSPVILIVFVFLLLKYQFAIFPVSKEIEKAYDKFFYSKKTLKDLHKKPKLAIGSTNLQTGRPFTFSRGYMGDSAYYYPSDGKAAIKFIASDFPISRAVTASSCVPFAFTPITIAKNFYEEPSDRKRINPQLVDGGVYDNQGIHKITQEHSSFECDIIITSDAGNRLPFEQFYNNTIILLIRTVDVFMNRIKNFQIIKNIYDNVETVNKQIAYLSLGWDLESCIPGFISNLEQKKIIPAVIKAHKIPEEWAADPKKYKDELTSYLEKMTKYAEIEKNNLSPEQLAIARGVKTNLTKLSADQVNYLMRQASNLTELQVRLYCPDIVPED